MTPQEIELRARRMLNAVGSSFWSQTEIMDYITAVCKDFSVETECIENYYSTSTVASQEQYTIPTRAIKIDRVEVDGSKLQKIDERQRDAMRNNITTTLTSRPQYYFEANEVFELYPVPDAVYTMKVRTIDYHDAVDTSSTLEIPVEYQEIIVHGVVAMMSWKEVGDPRGDKFWNLFEQKKKIAAAKVRKLKRGDNYTRVKTEEEFLTTSYGII